MEFFLNLLLFNGKFLTEPVSNTISETIRQCLRYRKKIILEYYRVTAVVGPYENMLDMINQNASDFAGDSGNNALLMETIESNFQFQDSLHKIKQFQNLGQNFGVISGQSMQFRRLGKKLYATKAPNRPVDPIAKNKSAANKVDERRRFHKKINDYLADNLNALLKSQELVFKNIEKLVSILEKDGKKLKEPRFDDIKKKITACKNILNNKPRHDLTIGRGIDEMVESEVTKCRQVKCYETMVKPRKVRVHPLSIKVLSKQKLVKKDNVKSISKGSKSSSSIKKSKVYQGSRSQNNLKLPTPAKRLDKQTFSRTEVAKTSTVIKSSTDLTRGSKSQDKFKYISPKRLGEEIDKAEFEDPIKKNVPDKVATKVHNQTSATNQQTGSEFKKTQAASESRKRPGIGIRKTSSHRISSEFLPPQRNVEKFGTSHTAKPDEIKIEEGISGTPQNHSLNTYKNTSKMIASEFQPPQKREATYTKTKEIKDEQLLVVPKNVGKNNTKTIPSTKFTPKLFEQKAVSSQNNDKLEKNQQPTVTNKELTDPIQAKDDDTKTIQFPQHWRIGETFKLVKTESKVSAYSRKEFADHKPKDSPTGLQQDAPEASTQNLQEKDTKTADDKTNFVLPKHWKIGQTFRVRRSDEKLPASKAHVGSSEKSKTFDAATRDTLQGKHTFRGSPSQNSPAKNDNVTDNKKITFQLPKIWQAGKTYKVTKTEIIKPTSSASIEGSRRTRLFPNSTKSTPKTSTETLQTKEKSKEVSANKKTSNFNIEENGTGAPSLRLKEVDDKKTSFKFPKDWRAGQTFKVERTEDKPATSSKAPDPCPTKTQLSGSKASTSALQTQEKPKGESTKIKTGGNTLTSPPKDGYKDEMVIDRTCLSETFVYNLAVREKLPKVTMKIRKSSDTNPKQSMSSDKNPPPSENSPSRKTPKNHLGSSREEAPAEDFSKSLKLKTSRNHIVSKSSDTGPKQSMTSDNNPPNDNSPSGKGPKNSVDSSRTEAPAEDFSKSLKLKTSKSHIGPKFAKTRESDPEITKRPPIKVEVSQSTPKIRNCPRVVPDVTRDHKKSKSTNKVSTEQATEKKPTSGNLNENMPKKASSRHDLNPIRKPSKPKIPSNTKIIQFQRPRTLDFDLINNQAKVIEVNENHFKQFETRLGDNLFTRRYLSLKEDFMDRCKRNFYNKRIFRRLEIKINAERRREEEKRMIENFFRVNDVMFQIMERRLLFQEPKEESMKICQLDDERWRLEAIDNDICVRCEQLDEGEPDTFNDDFNDNDYFKQIDHKDIKKVLEEDFEKSKIYELDDDTYKLTTNLSDDFSDNDYFKQLDTKASLENVARDCTTKTKIRQLDGETCGQSKCCETSCRKDVGRESSPKDEKSKLEDFNNDYFKKIDGQIHPVEKKMCEKPNVSQLDDERATSEALNNDFVKRERIQTSQERDKCEQKVLDNEPFDQINPKACQEIAETELMEKAKVSQLDGETKNLKVLNNDFLKLVEQKPYEEDLEAETPEKIKIREMEEQQCKQFFKQIDDRIFPQALENENLNQVKVSRVDSEKCQLNGFEQDDCHLKVSQIVENEECELKRIEKDDYYLKLNQEIEEDEIRHLRSLEKHHYFTERHKEDVDGDRIKNIRIPQITDKRSNIKTFNKDIQAEGKIYLAALEMAKVCQYGNEETDNIKFPQLDDEKSYVQPFDKGCSKQLDDSVIREISRTVENRSDKNEIIEDVELGNENSNLGALNKNYLEVADDKNCHKRLQKGKILQLVNELMKNFRISQLEDERSNLEILNSDYLEQADKISRDKLEKAKIVQLRDEIMENVTMSLLEDERSNLKTLNQEYLKQVDDRNGQDRLKKVEVLQLENELLKNIRISQLEDEISNLKALNKDYLKQVEDRKCQERLENAKLVALENEMMENIKISQLEDERSNLEALNKDHLKRVDDKIEQERLKNPKTLQAASEIIENIEISPLEAERPKLTALNKDYLNQLEDQKKAEVNQMQNITTENLNISLLDDEANLTALNEDYLKQVDNKFYQTQNTRDFQLQNEAIKNVKISHLHDGRQNLYQLDGEVCQEILDRGKVDQLRNDGIGNIRISQLDDERSNLQALNKNCLKQAIDTASQEEIEVKICMCESEIMKNVRISQLEEEILNLRALNEDYLKQVDDSKSQKILEENRVWQLPKEEMENVRITQLEEERSFLQTLNEDKLGRNHVKISQEKIEQIKVSQLEDERSSLEALNKDLLKKVDKEMCQERPQEVKIDQLENQRLGNIRICQLEYERSKLKALNQSYLRQFEENLCRIPNDAIKVTPQLTDEESYPEALNNDYSDQSEHKIPQEGLRKAEICQVKHEKVENMNISQLDDERHKFKTLNQNHFKKTHHQVCPEGSPKTKIGLIENKKMENVSLTRSADGKKEIDKAKTCQLEEAKCREYFEQIDNKMCRKPIEKQGLNQVKTDQLTEKQNEVHGHPKINLDKAKIVQLEEAKCRDYFKQIDNGMFRKSTEKHGTSKAKTNQKTEKQNEVYSHPKINLEKAKIVQLEEAKCRDYFKHIDNKMSRKFTEKHGTSKAKTSQKTEKQNEVHGHPKINLEKAKIVRLEEAKCRDYFKQIDNERSRKSTEKHGTSKAETSQKTEKQNEVHGHLKIHLEKAKIVQLEEAKCRAYFKQIDNEMSRKSTEKHGRNKAETSQKTEKQIEVNGHPKIHLEKAKIVQLEEAKCRDYFEQIDNEMSRKSTEKHGTSKAETSPKTEKQNEVHVHLKKNLGKSKIVQLEEAKCEDYFKQIENEISRKSKEKLGPGKAKASQKTEKQNEVHVHLKKNLENAKIVQLEEAKCKDYFKQLENEMCQKLTEKQGSDQVKTSPKTQRPNEIHVQPKKSVEKVKACQQEEPRCSDYFKQTNDKMCQKITENQNPNQVKTSQKAEMQNEVNFQPIDQEYLQEVLKADQLEGSTSESETFQKKVMKKIPSPRERTHIDNVMSVNKTAFEEFEQNLNVLLKPSTSKVAVKAPKTENTKRKIDDPVKKNMSTKHLEYTNLAKARNTFSYYNPYLLVKNANDAKKSTRIDGDKIANKNHILRKSNLQKLAELQDMKEMQNLTRMESKLRTEVSITRIKSAAGDSDNSKGLIRRTTKAAIKMEQATTARSKDKPEDETNFDRNSEISKKPQKLHEFSKFHDDQEPTFQTSEDESLEFDILERGKNDSQQNFSYVKLCGNNVGNVKSSSEMNCAKLLEPEVTTIHWELEDAENFHKIFVG